MAIFVPCRFIAPSSVIAILAGTCDSPTLVWLVVIG
jgi:hypothetical protein